MSIRFILDENLRGPLWQTVILHNQKGMNPIDVMCVGDPTQLSLGTKDPQLLLWCEREKRILGSHDTNSLPLHASAHWAAGGHLPGIFLIRPLSKHSQIVAFLALVTYASDEGDWLDRIVYL